MSSTIENKFNITIDEDNIKRYCNKNKVILITFKFKITSI